MVLVAGLAGEAPEMRVREFPMYTARRTGSLRMAHPA